MDALTLDATHKNVVDIGRNVEEALSWVHDERDSLPDVFLNDLRDIQWAARRALIYLTATIEIQKGSR